MEISKKNNGAATDDAGSDSYFSGSELKVFISHAFLKNDEELAKKFKQYLSENKISGYLAEKEPEYILPISGKIQREIENSDYLVAIITKNGLESASVHQEIGFAIGKDIPFMLMVDKGLKEKKGVFTHDKEVKYFDRMKFKVDSQEIIQQMPNEPRKKASSIDEPMKKILTKRNLLVDDDNTNFCLNPQTSSLQGGLNDELIPNGIPFVIFSAYPYNSASIEVNTKIEEFKKYSHIKTQKHNVRFLDGIYKPQMNALVYYDEKYSNSSHKNIRYKYLEFQENGFIEQGFSSDLIYLAGYSKPVPALHNCRLIGTFWAFLEFTKLYYEKNKIEKYDVMLSIRNSKDLTLLGYDEKFAGEVWTNDEHSPTTIQQNIRILIESLIPNELSNEHIAKKVRKIADQIANAYGLRYPTCYDSDGEFDWNTLDKWSFRRT